MTLIGQGHPFSNITMTLLRYIHVISLGSMRLIFIELYRVYKQKLQIFMLKSTPWPRKTSQGHPSLNLTKTLIEYIHGISLDPMQIIFVKLSSLQAKMANFHVEIDPMTSKNRSRSSIFELNQDTPIHCISLDPMRLIFVKLSSL